MEISIDSMKLEANEIYTCQCGKKATNYVQSRIKGTSIPLSKCVNHCGSKKCRENALNTVAEYAK